MVEDRDEPVTSVIAGSFLARPIANGLSLIDRWAKPEEHVSC
jgi:hypothetical protein